MKQKYKPLTRAPIYKLLNHNNPSALNKNVKQLCKDQINRNQTALHIVRLVRKWIGVRGRVGDMNW